MVQFDNPRTVHSTFCQLNSTFSKELNKILDELPPLISAELRGNGSLFEKRREEFIPEDIKIKKWLTKDDLRRMDLGELILITTVFRKKENQINVMRNVKKSLNSQDFKLIARNNDKSMPNIHILDTNKKEKEREVKKNIQITKILTFFFCLFFFEIKTSVGQDVQISTV